MVYRKNRDTFKSSFMDQFIRKLEERLSQPLPGISAQNLMKPKLPDGQPVTFRNKESPKPGAVLVLFYPGEDSFYFPLIQRPSYEGVHSGQIALPGGKKETYDRDLFDTALRETEEEIGVDKTKIEVIGSLTSFYVAASNYQVLPVIGYIREKPVFVPDHIEVEEVLQAPVNTLTKREFRKEKQIDVRGYPLIAPYFALRDKVVWGATAMMLSELSRILEEL